MLTLAASGAGAAGSSGRPTPLVQVRIVDPEGRELPPGETGEIVARGPTVMSGYHDAPRGERRAPGRRLAPHRTTSAGASPTAR